MKIKTIFIALLSIFSGTITQAQSNFKWDVVLDSLPNSKGELYSQTKMFIAENWNSANDVIQNDDKDGGIILIKSIVSITVRENFGVVSLTHYFNSVVTFYQKDGKCRMVVKVTPKSYRTSADPIGYYGGKIYTWKCVDLTVPFKNAMSTGLSRKGYDELASGVRRSGEQLVTSFEGYIRNTKTSPQNSNW